MNNETQSMLEIIRHLSVLIGARGSTTAAMHTASAFAAQELERRGVSDVRLEPFYGAPSTYRPFVAAFAAAALGTLLAILWGGTAGLAVGAILNGLGAWAMLAETDFAPHWARPLLPKILTRNVVGSIPPQAEARRTVVICAHLDTHRTPIFYSTRGWLNLFSILVAGTFACMALGAAVFGLGALASWQWLGWLGVLLLTVQVFALVMMAIADFTPHTPGANDNASGVAVALAAAERLNNKPLQHTRVKFLLTDCEETGASGVIAWLDAYAAEMKDALLIAIDQVGEGVVKYLTADGLVVKHATHPRALKLARAAHTALPEITTFEMVGPAYTDALPATKRGLAALTLCCVSAEDPTAGLHWHQMSDTLEHIQEKALADTLAFIWQVIQEVEQEV